MTQNLVSKSSLDELWRRHILDSLQLLDLAPAVAGGWVDVGSGAGFPGLVIAIASDRTMTLIEPRALRVAFLAQAIQTLGLGGRVRIEPTKAEAASMGDAGRVISARAVAPLPKLFAAAHHLATEETVWLLPKGRSAEEELAAARQTWQGEFRLVPSITDPASSIVVARHVRRRSSR